MKKALIVGNGLSSYNPHAAGIEKGRSIFRMNLFFLEPKLLFGKRVDYYWQGSHIWYVQYYVNKVVEKRLYDIKNVTGYKDRLFMPNSVFGTIIPTSVLVFIKDALLRGYDDIAIVGVDFYQHSDNDTSHINKPHWIKYLDYRLSKVYYYMYPSLLVIADSLLYRLLKRRITFFYRESTLNLSYYVSEEEFYKSYRTSPGSIVHNVNEDIKYLKHTISEFPHARFTVYCDRSEVADIYKTIFADAPDQLVVKMLPRVTFTYSPPFYRRQITLITVEFLLRYFLVRLFIKIPFIKIPQFVSKYLNKLIARIFKSK